MSTVEETSNADYLFDDDILDKIYEDFNERVRNSIVQAKPDFRNSRGVTILKIDPEQSLLEANEHGYMQGILVTYPNSRVGVKARLTSDYWDGSTFSSVNLDNDIKEKIQAAFNSLSPREALREIGRLWEVSEDNCRLAEARINILLRKCNDSIPPALQESLSDIVNLIDQPAKQSSIRSSHLFLMSLCKEEYVEPDVSVSSFDNIILAWEKEDLRIQIEFEECHLPWPGIKARYLKMDSTGVSRSVFFTAMELLVRFKSDYLK